MYLGTVFGVELKMLNGNKTYVEAKLFDFIQANLKHASCAKKNTYPFKTQHEQKGISCPGKQLQG